MSFFTITQTNCSFVYWEFEEWYYLLMKGLLNNRIFRYLLSGGLSFLVENGSFLAFFYISGIIPAISNILSIGVALIVNFFMVKNFVFAHRNRSKAEATKQLTLYLVQVAFNIFASTLIVVGLIHLQLPAYLAKISATLVIALWTYLIFKHVIFKTTNLND